MKIILGILVLLPTLTLASSRFVSRGIAYHCFQLYSEAVAQAMSSANESAQQICGYEPINRVSDFQITDGTAEQCQVIVEATYICQ